MSWRRSFKEKSTRAVNKREVEYQKVSDNESNEDDTYQQKDSGTEMPRRGPGRPKKIKTGLRKRPKKEYQPSARQATDVDLIEHSLLSEIPIRQALASQEAKEWHKAIEDELVSIIVNDTWTLVDRPKSVKVIGSRFVLRNKLETSSHSRRNYPRSLH